MQSSSKDPFKIMMTLSEKIVELDDISSHDEAIIQGLQEQHNRLAALVMTFRDRHKISIGKDKNASQDEIRRFNQLLARGISDFTAKPAKAEQSESSQQAKQDSKAAKEPEEKKEKKGSSNATVSSRRAGQPEKKEDKRIIQGHILTESKRLEEAEKPMRSRINNLIKYNH